MAYEVAGPRPSAASSMADGAVRRRLCPVGLGVTLLVVLATVSLATPGRAGTGPDDDLAAYFAWWHSSEDAVHDASARATLERLATTAASPWVRAQAHWDWARVEARAGNAGRAETIEAAAGYVRGAWLAPSRDVALSVVEGAPVRPVQADALEAGEGPGAPWQFIERHPLSRQLEISDFLHGAGDETVVLVVPLHTERRQTVALRFGASAPVALRLGGQPLGETAGFATTRPDQAAVSAVLERGANLVLLEFSPKDVPLTWVLRVSTLDGKPTTSVTLSHAAPDAWTPRRAARAVSATSRVHLGPAHDVMRAHDPSRWAAVELWRAASIARGLALPHAEHRASLEVSLLERLLRQPARGDEREATSSLLATAHLRLAALREEENPSAARLHLDEALRLGADPVEVHVARARIAERVGLIVEARAALAHAQRAAPEDPRWLKARLDLERHHGALSLWWRRRAAELAARQPTKENLEWAAEVAFDRGHDEEAYVLLASVGAREPTHAGYLVETQRRLEGAFGGEDDDANHRRLVSLLETQLHVRPESHHAARALALRHLAAGEDERAVALVAERKRAFPRRVEPLRLAAEVAQLRHDVPEALVALRAALSLRPQQRSLRQLEAALLHRDRALSRRYGTDARALPRDLPDGAIEVGAHVASHTVAMRVLPSGLGQVMIDRVIDVHDPRKVPELHEVRMDFAGGRERVEVEIAERITRAGQIRRATAIEELAPEGKQGGMYSDVRQQVVRFDELQPGDRLHVRMTRQLVGAQNLFGDFFGHLEPIEQPLPVTAWRVVVEAPKSRPIFHGGRRAPTPRVKEPEDRPELRIYDFSQRDVPRVVVEPRMPPYLEVAAYLSLSTYSQWADLAHWYRDLVQDRLQLDEELRALAHRLVDGEQDERARIRLIYEHVVEHTRYVGIELGLQGYRPFPVTEVYRRRYGDCKDTASLLVALLEEVGIPAQLALLRTADRGQLEAEPATMWAFNHAVAYVPSQDLFLDGTAERSHFRELPAHDQGALFLLIPPRGGIAEGTLGVVPLAHADENVNESSYEIEVVENGDLLLEGRERFRGVLGAAQRRELSAETSRFQQVQGSLATVMPGIELSVVQPTSLALADEEVGYDLAARVPHHAVLVGEGTLLLPLSLYPQQLVASYANQSSRGHDVWSSYPWRTRNVMRYHLPRGFVPEELPPSRRVDHAHLSFQQHITLEGNTLVVEEDTRLLSRRIPQADYPSFRAAALEADQLMRRRVRLHREAP